MADGGSEETAITLPCWIVSVRVDVQVVLFLSHLQCIFVVIDVMEPAAKPAEEELGSAAALGSRGRLGWPQSTYHSESGDQNPCQCTPSRSSGETYRVSVHTPASIPVDEGIAVPA